MSLQQLLYTRQLHGLTSPNLVNYIERKWYSNFQLKGNVLRPTQFSETTGPPFSYICSAVSTVDGALTCLASTDGVIEVHEPSAANLGEGTLRVKLRKILSRGQHIDHVIWGRDGKDEVIVAGKCLGGIHGFDLGTCSSGQHPTWKWGRNRNQEDNVMDIVMTGDNQFMACFQGGYVLRYDWRQRGFSRVCTVPRCSATRNSTVASYSNPYLVTGTSGVIQVYDVRMEDGLFGRKKVFDSTSGGSFTVLQSFPGAHSYFGFKSESGTLGYMDIAANRSYNFSVSPKMIHRADEIEVRDYKELMLCRAMRPHVSDAWYVRRRKGVIVPQSFGGGWRVITPSANKNGVAITLIAPETILQSKSAEPCTSFVPTIRHVTVVDSHLARKSIIAGDEKCCVAVFDDDLMHVGNESSALVRPEID